MPARTRIARADRRTVLLLVAAGEPGLQKFIRLDRTRCGADESIFLEVVGMSDSEQSSFGIAVRYVGGGTTLGGTYAVSVNRCFPGRQRYDRDGHM